MRTCFQFRLKIPIIARSFRKKEFLASSYIESACKSSKCCYCHSSVLRNNSKKPFDLQRTLHQNNYLCNRSTNARSLSAVSGHSYLYGTSRTFNKNINSYGGFSNYNQCAWYSSNAASGAQGSEGDGEDDPDNIDAEPQIVSPVSNYPVGAIATLSVPEVFPNVPVIVTNRFPIFPRFQKIIEVCQYTGDHF